MQTIKTAVVVVMLLAVLYGAYVALNGSDTPLPPELEQVGELNVEMGAPPPILGQGGGSSGGFFVQNNGTTNSANPGMNASGQTSQSPFAPGLSSPMQGSTMQGSLGSTSTPAPSPFLNPNLADTGKPFEPLIQNNSSLGQASNPRLGSNDGNAKSLPTLSPPALDSKPGLMQSNAIGSTNSSSVPPFGLTASTQANLAAPSILPAPINNDPKSLTVGNEEANKEKEEWKGLPNNTTTKSYQNAKTMAMDQASKGDLKDALATLSLFFNAPELTHEQHQELREMLDSLAGEVIYSRRHLLDSPYSVLQGETLESIANKYEVPADILGKINAIEPNGLVVAGTKLKVVPGPFRAEVDLTRNEMTLFLGELYAGRFAIEVGADPLPKEGPFQVVEKQRNRNFYGKGGTSIPGGDPRNPYGGLWIDLGQDICIHGTPDQPLANSKELGCISLSPIDANDVFGMLSRGSRVQIRR